MAERAYRLLPSPTVADTLGWVHFKLGDAAAALPYLDRAAKLGPANADILIHAATVHAALNNLPQARTYLDAALKVDPKIADRADVKALREKIK
jgi:tetratricopeptide (TPR) repeat protein